MKTVSITKRMYQAGNAYDGWTDAGGFGRVGGPYADLLCSACEPDDPISIVSLANGVPVGQINLIKGAVILKGERSAVYWGSGFVVPPEHRSTGAGMAIMARMRALVPGSGAVSISQQALPLYQKMGWISLTAQRYLLPVRPSTFLRFKLGRAGWVGVVGALADGVAKVCLGWVRFSLKRLTPRLRVERLDAARDVDPQWFGPHTNRPFSTERSAEWLQRIMTQGPMDNCRRLFCVRTESGSILGYFITTVALREGVANGRFGDLRVASLRDWVSFDQTLLTDETVMLMGLKQLIDTSCDVIELCVPNGQPSKWPSRLGMIRMGQFQFAVRLAPSVSQLYTDLSQPEHWWYRPGDGDAFLL